MNPDDIADYLKQVYRKDIVVTGTGKLGETEEGLKEFGYGKPLLIRFSADGEAKSAVLSSMRTEGGFGHDHFSDRAQILIWQYATFNRLPEHVRSIDCGYFTHDGRLKSAGDAEEYFLLMEEVEGVEYFLDLERIRSNGATELDVERASALSGYLADIHARKHNNRELYVRRIRDLVGHGECIMGLMDSYPDDLDFITGKELAEIERSCVDWRWKLKSGTDRLCMVHGDFHPFGKELTLPCSTGAAVNGARQQTTYRAWLPTTSSTRFRSTGGWIMTSKGYTTGSWRIIWKRQEIGTS